MMSRKDVAVLLKALREQGFEVKMGGRGHWKIYAPDGHLITTLPASPGDVRGIRNATAVLRRAGLVWPPKR